MKGIVIRNTGSWYTVLTDDGEQVDSKIKGNFRLKGIRSTNPVAVGDRVEIIRNQEGTAFIKEIDERRNYIVRKSPNLSKQSHVIAANVDQAVLIVTVNYPVTSTTFIDRFLASAEAYRIPVLMVFNKLDLLDEDDRRLQEMMVYLYESIGYTCLQVSATTGEGIASLEEALKGKRWERYKLVEGRSNRKITDEQAVVEAVTKDLWLFQGDFPIFQRLPFPQLYPHP